MCNAQDTEADCNQPAQPNPQPPPALAAAAALFLDLDGTLIEIAPRPDLVKVPAGLPVLLARLAAMRAGAVAVVSGRTLAQIDRLLSPWRGAAAGLHGAERRRADGSLNRSADPLAAAALEALRPRLAAIAGRRPGVVVEDKIAGLALHYRGAPERESEIRGLAESLRDEAGGALRVIAGKMVVEFQSRTVNKGTAIAAFLAEPPFRGRPPVFIGDDVTDEDGFAEINRRGGVTVRVGRPGESAARFSLPSVAAALAWLGDTGG